MESATAKDAMNKKEDLLAEYDPHVRFTYAQHCLLDSYQLEDE